MATEKHADESHLCELALELVERAKAADAEFVDVRLGWGQCTSVVVQDGRVHESIASSPQGAGIRVIVGGAWGTASTDSLQAEACREAMDRAVALAKAASGRVEQPAKVAEVPGVEREIEQVGRVPCSSVPLSERVRHVAEIEAVARRHDGRVVNTYVSYSDVSSHVVLANSFGSLVRWREERVSVSMMVAASDGQTRQAAHNGLAKPGGWEVLSEIDPEEFALRPAKRAVELLSAAPAPAGAMPVIMDQELRVKKTIMMGRLVYECA